MPSQSFLLFETQLISDVNRLITSHAALNHEGRGRRGLGHITRSGVIMLCAAWELYLEELVVEMVGKLVDRTASPTDLPPRVRLTISKHVKAHENDLMPLKMAGEGWKEVYGNLAREYIRNWNTPKAGPVEIMFNNLVGWEDSPNAWSRGADFVKDFVVDRGDIAHRGSSADYINIIRLINYRDGIVSTALEHDNAACDFLVGKLAGPSPWRRRGV